MKTCKRCNEPMPMERLRCACSHKMRGKQKPTPAPETKRQYRKVSRRGAHGRCEPRHEKHDERMRLYAERAALGMPLFQGDQG